MVKFTIETVQKFEKENGLILLSTEYSGVFSLLNWKCVECGKEYLMCFDVIKRGHGKVCPKCAHKCGGMKKRHKLEAVCALARERGGECLSTEYVVAHSKLNMICKHGHLFSITFDKMLGGRWCPTCGRSKSVEGRKYVIENMHQWAADRGWTCLSTEYVDAHTKLEWKCGNKDHPSWWARPNNIQQGQGCPFCAKHSSSQEQEIVDFLIKDCKIDTDTIIRNTQSILRKRDVGGKLLRGKEIDIYLPDYKVGIEYHGLYYHNVNMLMKKNCKTFTEAKEYHKLKADLADEVGIHLIQIFSDEWNSKREVLKKLIKNVLGKSKDEKIHARKCDIRYVESKDAKDFLRKHHFQFGGKSAGTLRLGLYYKDKLASLMTFKQGSRRQNIKKEDGVYDLYKYCTSCKVLGGLQKLLRFFEQKHCPKKIYTFCDRRFFSGKAFIDAGFSLNHKTEPGYCYFILKEGIREDRWKYRSNDEAKALKISERSYNTDRGRYQIYDAGHLKLEKTYNM